MVERIRTNILQGRDLVLSVSLILALCITSFVSWYLSYVNKLVLVYNDAKSHIDIARLVVDNQEPGLSQLGTVWLPFSHILPLVFVWNDWFWRTGMASSIFSMLAYVISVIAIYKIVMVLAKKRAAAIIGALAFAANLNILYLQTTALTEPLYLSLFVITVYLFVKYITTDNIKYVPLLGLLGFLQVITRYDGWFVVGVLGLLLFSYDFIIKRCGWHESVGKMLLYGFPVGLSVALWLLWNLLIFGDMFYFATGPYSAKAQQTAIEETAGLITKGSLYWSSKAYTYAMLHNVGLIALGFSLVGLIVFLKNKFTVPVTKKILLVILLAAPIIFNILALILGFSILNVPELNWSPFGNDSKWFNVRYGILALPFVAILIGTFASWRKLAAIIAFEIIILQSIIMYTGGISTIIDGTVGSSTFSYKDVTTVFGKSVKPEDKVLMSFSFFNPIAFESNLALKQFVHEGVSKKWNKALKNPQNYAEFVVMSSHDENEPVRRSLHGQEKFQILYEQIYSDDHTSIYRLKNS
jgi:hypothetical protein